jgi:holin-like protein
MNQDRPGSASAKAERAGDLIAGLVQILLFQGFGELLSKFVLPAIPGPVFGLMALLTFLAIRGKVNDSLGFVADAFSRHLGLLFVPAAVGVVLFLPQLRANFVGVLAALILSVILSIAVTALILRVLDRDGKNETKSNAGGPVG